MLTMSRVALAKKGSAVLSPYLEINLRTGTGASVVTPTALNLVSAGGLILTKSYNGTHDWSLVDTVRGISNDSSTSSTAAPTTQATGITALSAASYTTGTLANRNSNTLLFVDYVMQQAPKFLQIMERVETGSPTNVAHALGVAPGFIMAKSKTAANGWYCWHRFSDLFDPSASTSGFSLNSSAAGRYASYSDTNASIFSTEIYAWDGSTEARAWQGGTVDYYLFAHDPSPTGRIQCGGYQGNGTTTGPVITLGWTPRLLLVKCRTAVGDWIVVDTSRGFSAGNESILSFNLATIPAAAQLLNPTATGFQPVSTSQSVNGNGQTYMYVAFR